MDDRLRERLPVGVLVSVVVVTCAAACLGGGRPLLAPERSLTGGVVVLAPEVRLGSPGSSPDEQRLSEALALELRSQLADSGLRLVAASRESPAVEAAREALLVAWGRARAAGRKGLRTDRDLGIEPSLAGLEPFGASAAFLAVLVRQGLFVGEGEYVPRPAGELVELPEDRLDYEIPSAAAYRNEGIELDVLLVSTSTGRILASRKVSHPALAPREVLDALPGLTREAIRGLRGSR